MTDAARLTPLGAMVLALLTERDMHPYEMIRLLRERRDDRIVRVTNGTLYHTVSRLERDGLIAEVGVDRDGNRPERTTYTLRSDSRMVLEEWVRAGLRNSERTAEFRVALAEAHNLPRTDVIDLLAARRDALQNEHDALQQRLDEARVHGVPAQFLIETDRHITLLNAELTWTDALLERLADPDFAWIGDHGSSASSPCMD
ncbi:PadR family transcriptional regulator [Microbacterium sp. ARD32]|uniref:PadR family transcriptional regulator n=1 Tax=Microbacterium sp. ARD32 TaxID=2962577 RepID=UPI002881614C|nr:PadR family transcriptional regulator [Microbacterium sp. ARD32]MDT0156062.1 PadR family transcriptional regulator [Microbacterium sp. ARD32]